MQILVSGLIEMFLLNLLLLELFLPKLFLPKLFPPDYPVSTRSRRI